jgi:hypothetical protein
MVTRIPGFSRTLTKYFQGPGIFSHKTPGLSRFSRTCGDPEHGLVKKRSYLTNLLEFLEFVTKHRDEGFSVEVIFLDFQKAFDN